VIDDCIECPYHGWRYRGDGQCTLVPARKELTDVLKGKVKSYQVVEQSGLIWVCLSQAKFPVPSYPEFDDQEYRISFPNVYDWRTSTPRRLENFIDFSHFPFVHHGSIGTRSNPRVETFESWREDAVLRFRRSGVKEPNLPWHRELMGVGEGEIEPINEYYVTMPHTVRLVRKFPNDCTYVIFMATSPVDGSTSRSFTIQARNYGKDAQNDKLFTDMNDTVIEEDRPVIESQRPVMIPLMPEEAHMELPVRGADAITTEYRRWLLQLMKELHPS
jgi:phenylpropionate dioxygenase-like ring-hydroxylating dioxygenase large terminal subunit